MRVYLPRPDERLAMTSGKEIGRERSWARQRRVSGECSTSVESSSRVSPEMQVPAASAMGTCIRRRGANQTAKQCDADVSGRDEYYDDGNRDIPDDTAAENPELEAYCDGSWWDVKILKRNREKYYVHYQKFTDQSDQWVPLIHLRIRCRISILSDCHGIVPGIDVCVMTRHPHSDGKPPAWYDARIIDVERRPHTLKACKCWFRIALYTIPDVLPSDFTQRKRLPVSSNSVVLRKMSIMREAQSMPFHQVVAASLPGVTNPQRILAKDGVRWYSSLDLISVSRDRSFSFESRVAGGSFGLSLSEGHHEDRMSPEQLRSFDAFLEEEGIVDPQSLNRDVGEEDAEVPVVSGSKAQPIVLDLDDVAMFDNDDMADDGIKHRDRYSSDESDDSDRANSPEKVEKVWVNPNPTSRSQSLRNPDDDLDEVVVSDLHPLKPSDRSPLEPISLTPDIISPSPSVQTIPSVPVTVRPVELVASSEDSDVDFAEYLEQSIDAPVTSPADEPVASPENSDGDGFAAYLERSIAIDYCAKPFIAEDHVLKRNIAEMHGAKRSSAKIFVEKRRRLNPIDKYSFYDNFFKGRSKTKPLPRQSTEQPRLKKAVKERETRDPCENLKTVRSTLTSYQGGKNLGRTASTELEEYAGELEELLIDERPEMTVREKLAHSKETPKTGLPQQGLKEKKSKKVVKDIAAVPKFVEREITYAELFESVEPVQFDIPSVEKVTVEESGLLSSWNPLLESVIPALPQDVKCDPLNDIWEVMRAAQEIEEEVVDRVKQLEVDCADSVATCENPDGTQHPKHGALKFDQEVGEVCEMCGAIVNDIKDMWARDNAKRIAVTKDGNYDSDADKNGCDQDVLAFWDPEEENHDQRKDSEECSNFDLIPELISQMKAHQKQGFQFLWRNLDGQGSIGNTGIENGGCVLSHAPGTGKTFLIISFLHSYMKKYPKTRPIILAPKIMLQPWAKEFSKWKVNIPVYNFNQASEQGRIILQQHEDAGRVRINHSGRSQGKKLLVFREALLYEWIRIQSVLTISYPMFNNLYKTSPSDTRMFTLRKLLLEHSTIMILDEGHIVRNKKAQVLKQLNAVKTPLRVMLSGTLFQNNFEELYTCLNVVRSGFVKTFAKAAGLKFNIQQELEPLSDVESEQLATERKDKAYKLTELQARRLFIEEIGNKIDKGQKTKSSSESLAEGLAQLRRLTSPFIHHYTGGVLKKNLLPLRDFAILFQPTDLQERMIKSLSTRMGDKTMLERECLLSLVCIHPTLFSQHNVGKTHTDLLSPEEMLQVASNRDPAVGVKTRFVINLLKHLRLGQEKILIFCQNLDPLLLLEEMLGKEFDWVREREILQIDGKVQPDERQTIIERFNDKNDRVRVLLASTKACGEGVTLIGASRVVFMDVLWNPAVIRQAIHRAYRMGQEKVVHVYRLVFAGTFEQGKYRRMVWKDHKSQALFFESQETAEKNKSAGPGFWDIPKQRSKDPILNELCRLDSELSQPAFKRIFRHGGLFDDDYEVDPEGKGTDAIDWLRGNEDADNSVDLETDDSSGDEVDTEDFDGLDDDV